MALATIAKLLGTSAELKALAAKAEKIRALETLYARCVPRSLARSSRVKSCRAGTLVVCADNPATGAKLRQLAPTVVACMRESDAAVIAMKVEVEVSGAARARSRGPNKKPLTADAVREFRALGESLPDGDLKAAVAKLVRHHTSRR